MAATTSRASVDRDVTNNHYNDGMVQCVCWHLLKAPHTANNGHSLLLTSLNADWMHILKILTTSTHLSNLSEKLIRLVSLCARIDSVLEDGHHMKELEDVLWLLEVMRSYSELENDDKVHLEELITETQCQIIINYQDYGYESKGVEKWMSYFHNITMTTYQHTEPLSQSILQLLKYRFSSQSSSSTSSHPHHLMQAEVEQFLDEHSRRDYCKKLSDFVVHLTGHRFKEPVIFTEFMKRTLEDDIITDSPELLTPPVPSSTNHSEGAGPSITIVTSTTAPVIIANNEQDGQTSTREKQTTPDIEMEVDINPNNDNNDDIITEHMEEDTHTKNIHVDGVSDEFGGVLDEESADKNEESDLDVDIGDEDDQDRLRYHTCQSENDEENHIELQVQRGQKVHQDQGGHRGQQGVEDGEGVSGETREEVEQPKKRRKSVQRGDFLELSDNNNGEQQQQGQEGHQGQEGQNGQGGQEGERGSDHDYRASEDEVDGEDKMVEESKKEERPKRNVKPTITDSEILKSTDSEDNVSDDDDFKQVPKKKRTKSARSKLEEISKTLDNQSSSCSTPTKTLPEKMSPLKFNFHKDQLHQPTNSRVKSKQARMLWSSEEVKYLKQGVKRCGEGNWKKILKMYPFSSYRTNIHLKDKWRNLNTRK